MLRRTAASFAVLALVASGAAGTASAAKPRAASGKGQVVAAPSGPGSAARLVGTPYHGNPGDANKAECQAIADIAQAIHDSGASGADAAVDATLGFGQVRGCVFTGGFN